jgi:hypothetical protein
MATQAFPDVPRIECEGAKSKNPLAFKRSHATDKLDDIESVVINAGTELCVSKQQFHTNELYHHLTPGLGWL